MMRLRVVDVGPHLRIESPLCAECPGGSTGCCATPPVLAWADLGRIASLGGAAWLERERASGRLHPCARGLAIERVANPDAAASGRLRKCTYHAAAGCTVPFDRRSATCNHYVCDDAFAASGDRGAIRRLHDRTVEQYAAWDRLIEARVRARHGRDVPWGEPFFAWLGEAFSQLVENGS